MAQNFKPKGYNSVSPYFVVDGAQKLADLLMQIFDAKELRRYDRADGGILHMELQVDDSVIMLADATEQYPARTQMVHIYVPDVDVTWKKAIVLGCAPVEEPVQKEGDPDKRGAFTDIAGNYWSVGMQVKDE